MNQSQDPYLNSSSSQILIKASEKKNYVTKHTNLAFNDLRIENNSPFGCSKGSKNSLDKNYHLSIKKLGGKIFSNSKTI